MVCIRCQKRPAIIFIQRMENGQMKQEGYCLHCARELHIKPVDDLMKQFGMSEQDLDNMENRMESMMEELGDSNPLSMLMNMSGSGEDADAENMDEDLVPGSNATFPLGFTGTEKQDGEKKADRENGKNTLVVRLGAVNARRYHACLLMGSLVCLALFNLFSLHSLWGWLFLLAAPLLVKQARYVMREMDPVAMRPMLERTVKGALLTNLLFVLGIFLSQWAA